MRSDSGFLNIHTIDLTGCKLLKRGELEKLTTYIKELEAENANLSEERNALRRFIDENQIRLKP